MIEILKTSNDAASWLKSKLDLNAGVKIQIDSRQIKAGDAFIAWEGAGFDAREFLINAINSGASACLIEARGIEAFVEKYKGFESKIAAIENLKDKLSEIAGLFYENPSEKLNVIAVTGTNGKTSVSYWTAAALNQLGTPCGFIGTIGMGILPKIEPSSLTTPDPVTVQRKLFEFEKVKSNNIENNTKNACIMEASSIGINEGRLNAVNINIAIFTNFTQDHLDYHGNMQNYWAAKELLFSWRGIKSAVLFIDDEKISEFAKSLKNLDIWTISIKNNARIFAKNIMYQLSGLEFEIHERGYDTPVKVKTNLIGEHNVANALCTVAALRALGFTLEKAASAIEKLPVVAGRMEIVTPINPRENVNIPLVIVDYAHTPDAVEKVLEAVRPLAKVRGGKIISVLGCGGNRDKTKRPLMAAAANNKSDITYLTSDNPRNEEPNEILKDMQAGINKNKSGQTIIEADRNKAITCSIKNASEKDIVLILGKGHENYQEIKGVRHKFSDVENAAKALENII